MTNTQWEKVNGLSAETEQYLRGRTHSLWSCIRDNEHIFTVRPNGETPGANDGGYRSINAALKVKGMDQKRIL